MTPAWSRSASSSVGVPSGTSTLTPSTTSVSELTVRPTAVECCLVSGECGSDVYKRQDSPQGVTGHLGSGRELSPSETEREAGARRAPLALASLHATDPACALVGTRLTYAMTLPAFGPLGLGAQHRFEAVSYTHLDVYKRQPLEWPA